MRSARPRNRVSHLPLKPTRVQYRTHGNVALKPVFMPVEKPTVALALVPKVIEELNSAGIWNAPIVTEIAPLSEYYAAEDYHQDYFENNPYQPYCQMVVAPKVAKFRQKYLEKLKR